MRALLIAAVALLPAVLPACSSDKPPAERLPAEDSTVAVTGPTMVAAWRRVTQAEVDADENLALLLFDYERYVAGVTPELQKAGVAVHPVGVKRIRLSEGTPPRTVADVASTEPRYILAAPGRPPRVIEGLQTDAALLRAAAEYFDKPELRPGGG